MKKYLLLLSFSICFVMCADDMHDWENGNVDVRQEISLQGGDKGDDGPKGKCNCEELAPPILIKTGETNDGCCEFSFSTAVADQSQTDGCAIYLQILQDGAFTHQVFMNEVSSTISICDGQSVTINMSIDNGWQIAHCWSHTFDCTSDPLCGCDVQITNDGCEVTACVDKNSCDFWGFGHVSPPGYPWDPPGDVFEDGDYACRTFTARADLEYEIWVASKVNGEHCRDSYFYQVEGCLDCSEAEWNVYMEGPKFNIFCNQADGLSSNFEAKLFYIPSHCCAEEDLGKAHIVASYEIYNYSHDPPTLISSNGINKVFDLNHAGGYYWMASFLTNLRLGCDDIASGDHLHFELEYDISHTGACMPDKSGRFLDFYIVQDYDLIPCCMLPSG